MYSTLTKMKIEQVENNFKIIMFSILSKLKGENESLKKKTQISM